MSDADAAARIIDANLNRAMEGLRVCEDLVRFAFGPSALFPALRRLRHALMRQARRLPTTPVELARVRRSRSDPGRRSSSASARSLEHVLLINLQRAKEALRVLEEMSRLVAPSATAGFQRIRFHTYEIERRLLLHVAALRHHRSRRRART